MPDFNQDLIPQTVSDFTISLGGLADAAARQSDIESNTDDFPAIIGYARLRMGTGPTAGTVCRFHLLREDDGTPVYRTDGAGALDAAITISNATPLAVMAIEDATNSKDWYVDLDSRASGVLGQGWGIAVGNESGAALDATDSNHIARFAYYQNRAVQIP